MLIRDQNRLPLFFTHVIGSLPRPQVVRDLLARRQELPTDRFEKLMDEMVIFAMRLQEQAGIDVISDGEWRRIQYVDEFLDRIGGFERARRYEHAGEVKYHRVVVRKLNVGAPVFAKDAQFLADHTDRCTKFALPSPFLIALRYWHGDYSSTAYPTYQHFMDDLAAILAREAQAVVAAGIDIVQIDDPALTYFCDRHLMAGELTHDERLRRDWNVDKEFPAAVAAINRVVEGLDAEIHLHCCHSVYKRRSDVNGDYKPILPRLQNVKVDRVNLEFAYTQTGAISDLEYLPQHLALGMGVVDVRREEMQSVDEIEAIAAAGARILSPERIALNPDCGFAPGAGEPPTIDKAFEKLSRLVQAAARLRQRSARGAVHGPPTPA
jgi:5-methyltetrahydropteroyltriglutamate--homocysteine methyltransferase